MPPLIHTRTTLPPGLTTLAAAAPPPQLPLPMVAPRRPLLTPAALGLTRAPLWVRTCAFTLFTPFHCLQAIQLLERHLTCCWGGGIVLCRRQGRWDPPACAGRQASGHNGSAGAPVPWPAGSVIGGLAAAALVAVGVWYAVKKRRTRARSMAVSNPTFEQGKLDGEPGLRIWLPSLHRV